MNIDDLTNLELYTRIKSRNPGSFWDVMAEALLRADAQNSAIIREAFRERLTWYATPDPYER